MLVIATVVVVLLVSVTACVGLGVPTFCVPKSREGGSMPMADTPVPIREKYCGLEEALSVMVTLEVSPVVLVGL